MREGYYMRCVSWNVNGIRAIARKGIDPWTVVPDAAVVCLQETKAHREQAPKGYDCPEGWHAAWHSAVKPGYSGVAIFAKREPDEIITGMNRESYDNEGRVIAMRFDDVVVIGAYFPNSQEAGKRIDYKLGFCAAMERFLAKFRRKGYHTVLMGDYNIAHHPIDLARPDSNEQNPGYLPEEREWMTRYVDQLGYHDVFREANPDLTGAYTWWTYRGGARGRNVGWRIDYATVSPDFADRVSGCAIHPDVMGSDHCPVSIDIEV